MLASTDNFVIIVRGRGGHASTPHMAAHPVPVACEIGLARQTLVTRSVNVFSPAVLTVGKIEAGTAANIIPETATLHGTIRTLSPATRATLVEGVRRVAHGVSAAHGLEAEGEAPNAHSNRYLLNEEALPTGIALYAGGALAYLEG